MPNFVITHRNDDNTIFNIVRMETHKLYYNNENKLLIFGSRESKEEIIRMMDSDVFYTFNGRKGISVNERYANVEVVSNYLKSCRNNSTIDNIDKLPKIPKPLENYKR